MRQRTKIAYILPRFPKLTETFILREMTLLRRLGLEVYVFSVLPPLSTPVHEQVQEMMPYVHYSPFIFSARLIEANISYFFRSPLKYLRAFYWAIWQTYREPLVLLRTLLIFPKSVYFASQMQDLGIDHIHAHFVWINGISAKIVSDLTGITYSLHPHAFGLFMRDQKSVRRQLELATGIVTVSEYHRQYIANLCPRWSSEEINIVHYGLNPDDFVPAPIPAQDSGIRIISVGSLIEKKGHEYLIDACALLMQKGYKFDCSIVGGGDQTLLQARINKHNLQDHVFLTGPKKQTEVYNLYCRSDIFVLACVVAQSGDRDGMPNVLLEAMAMEIPVVTTPVTGIPELVVHEQTGLLVSERDSSDLALAIERLMQDSEFRHKMGCQGRQTVLERFDIHNTTEQLAQVFQGYVSI